MRAKKKIFIALAIWLAVSAGMLSYGFKILDKANKATLQKISEQQKEVSELESEQESFRLAQQDLTQLKAQPLQPDDFFSKDVTLVKQIETLEGLGEKLKVNFNLSGLSGTVKNAPKAKTQSDIAAIPYGIGLNGPFSNVVDFIETLENLDFITHLNTLSLSSAGGGNVSANLSAIFYVRKQ